MTKVEFALHLTEPDFARQEFGGNRRVLGSECSQCPLQRRCYLTMVGNEVFPSLSENAI